MKKSFIILLLIESHLSTSIPSLQHPSWVNYEEAINISEFTHHLYRRYYFIARLGKTINTLKNLNKEKQKKNLFNILPIQCNETAFTHQLIIQCINDITKENSLSPLFKLWEPFRTFKWVDDMILIKELVRLICIIIESLYNQLTPFSSNPINSNHLVSLPISDILNCIDIYHDYILHYHPTLDSLAHHNHSLIYSHQQSKITDADSSEDIGAITITLRFYLLNRLQKAWATLRNYKNKKIIFKEVTIDNVTITIFKYQINFNHLDIKTCLHKMCQTSNIKPLLQLCDKFQQFQYIEDIQCMKEFLKLIVITNMEIILNKFYKKTVIPPSLYNEINTWYEAIENSNVERLLAIVDKSIDQIEQLENTFNTIKKSLPLHNNRKTDPKIENELFSEVGIEGGKFAYFVARRYYFIQRLQPIILMLLQAENVNIQNLQNIFSTAALEIIDSSKFRNINIKQSIEAIKACYNLKPLFMLWEDFIAYKSLEDQIFIEDFTKEILIISLSMSNIQHPNHLLKNINKLQSTNIPIEVMLDKIDICMEKYITTTRYEYATQAEPTFLEKDLDPFIILNDVVLRFYLITRLEKVFNFLRTVQKNKLYFSIHQSIITDKLNLISEPIKSCVEKLTKHNDVASLIKLICDVEQFKFIKDKKFSKDFLVLMLTVCNTITQRYSEDIAKEKSTLTTLANIYEKLEQLPLEEILDAIDMVAEELPGILEKYEFDSNLNWRVWLRKYWWVPPVVLSTFVVKILLKHKLHELGNHFSASKKSEKGEGQKKSDDNEQITPVTT